jgi:hypothetical protein
VLWVCVTLQLLTPKKIYVSLAMSELGSTRWKKRVFWRSKKGPLQDCKIGLSSKTLDKKTVHCRRREAAVTFIFYLGALGHSLQDSPGPTHLLRPSFS